jgi:hypothetical protein
MLHNKIKEREVGYKLRVTLDTRIKKLCGKDK